MMEYHISEIHEISLLLVREWKEYAVWCFEGEMGSGKTTLIKAVCSTLGVADSMSSPTFSIVNEYLTHDGQNIYHFDFYRIEKEEEAIQVGVEDYFFSGDMCLVEWPERVPNLLPASYLKISVNLVEDNRRALTITPNG